MSYYYEKMDLWKKEHAKNDREESELLDVSNVKILTSDDDVNDALLSLRGWARWFPRGAGSRAMRFTEPGIELRDRTLYPDSPHIHQAVDSFGAYTGTLVTVSRAMVGYVISATGDWVETWGGPRASSETHFLNRGGDRAFADFDSVERAMKRTDGRLPPEWMYHRLPPVLRAELVDAHEKTRDTWKRVYATYLYTALPIEERLDIMPVSTCDGHGIDVVLYEKALRKTRRFHVAGPERDAQDAAQDTAYHLAGDPEYTYPLLSRPTDRSLNVGVYAHSYKTDNALSALSVFTGYASCETVRVEPILCPITATYIGVKVNKTEVML